MMIKVSIITPVFNAARFLPRLFESIKSQYGFEYEHILVDDCSSDNSLQIIRAYALNNFRVRVIASTENKGPVIARNLAIKVARGKYLAFLDADDYWLPDKLFVQTQFMETSSAFLSFTDYRSISEDGSLVGRRLCGPRAVGHGLHHMTRFIGCLTIMINREKCVDFMFPEISPAMRAEDFLAWSLLILRYGPAKRCGHDLARYSVVRFSRSSNALRSAKSIWLVYRYVENLSLIRTLIYFSCYGIFTVLKRFWFRPRWSAIEVDGGLCHFYQIKDV
jgi:glycosyltransferase involved in cell wall biosynthesis